MTKPPTLLEWIELQNAMPDPDQPDTLGWRMWRWCEEHQQLVSPSQPVHWPEAELVAANWGTDDAVRGVAGVHAARMPMDWLHAGSPAEMPATGPDVVTGIVERFGKFVLGTQGWRAEWVVIKELLAPSTEIGLALERVYPDVIVHYRDQQEEDKSCILEKSSASASARCPYSSHNTVIPVLTLPVPLPAASLRQPMIQITHQPAPTNRRSLQFKILMLLLSFITAYSLSYSLAYLLYGSLT